MIETIETTVPLQPNSEWQ